MFFCHSCWRLDASRTLPLAAFVRLLGAWISYRSNHKALTTVQKLSASTLTIEVSP